MMRAVLLALTLGACVRVENRATEVFPVDQEIDLVVSHEVGRFEYDVGSETELRFQTLSYAEGSSRKQAEAREAGNRVDYTPDGTSFYVDATVDAPQAGIDIASTGPSFMNLDVDLGSGSAYLSDVEGTHWVNASWIEGSRVVGEGDFYAVNSMDLELWPYVDGDVYIEVDGPTTLRLPYGGPYDIVVYGDPYYEIYADELGYDDLYIRPGYLEARRRPGTTKITVYVRWGPFYLLESR